MTMTNGTYASTRQSCNAPPSVSLPMLGLRKVRTTEVTMDFHLVFRDWKSIGAYFGIMKDLVK